MVGTVVNKILVKSLNAHLTNGDKSVWDSMCLYCNTELTLTFAEIKEKTAKCKNCNK